MFMFGYYIKVFAVYLLIYLFIYLCVFCMFHTKEPFQRKVQVSKHNLFSFTVFLYQCFLPRRKFAEFQWCYSFVCQALIPLNIPSIEVELQLMFCFATSTLM